MGCDSQFDGLSGDGSVAVDSLLKKREGDQELPRINSNTWIQHLVISDIVTRTSVGISRYGTGLQAHNGRDTLRDLYEELLDAAIYTRQLIEERNSAKGDQ